MTCSAGCLCAPCRMGNYRAMSGRPELARRRPRRVRTIGQASSDFASSFDWQGTVSQVQNYGTQAKNIYNQASAIASSSDEAKKEAAFQAIMAGMAVAVPGVGTALAGALELLRQVAPQAGSGPGTCVTDPPKGCLDKSWSHYSTMQRGIGGYPPPAPGSFEELAYGMIEHNYELLQNCCWQQAQPMSLVLATAIDAWNKTHFGPSRTVSRTLCDSFGCPDDPISYALYSLPTCDGQPFGDTSCWPKTRSFNVNNGPVIPPPKKVIALHVGPVAAAKTAPATSPATKAVLGTAAVAGAGAVAWYWPAIKAALVGLVR